MVKGKYGGRETLVEGKERIGNKVLASAARESWRALSGLRKPILWQCSRPKPLCNAAFLSAPVELLFSSLFREYKYHNSGSPGVKELY